MTKNKFILYHPRPVKGMSFKGVKVHSLPNQSMSLKEILKRFVRRESLPVSKSGIYEDRYGDLEKLSKEDITVQMEVVDALKDQIKKGRRGPDPKPDPKVDPKPEVQPDPSQKDPQPAKT